MSQPAYLVVGRVCPNQLIWSLEHIRCPKFGRGAGGHQRLGQCPNCGTFYFLMASLNESNCLMSLIQQQARQTLQERVSRCSPGNKERKVSDFNVILYLKKTKQLLVES